MERRKTNGRSQLRLLKLGTLLPVIGFCLLLETSSCANRTTAALKKKVLVLGFDGMDPQILNKLIEEGKLPNFEHLKNTGDFKQLATTTPPQSPVAWSSFITGMNPGGHGIFDFMHRDPETITPFLSTSRTESSSFRIGIGSWRIPLFPGKVSLLRSGKAFWEILKEHGIPSTILRVPANFPPVNTSVYQLSGMGTPDIQGTYGMYSFYTEEPVDSYGDVSGGKVFYLKVVDNKVEAKLPGPNNTFRKGNPRSLIDFTVWIDPENRVAKITVQDQKILLKQGEWSHWVKVNFELIPFLHSVRGICRFYLKELYPHFKLYVSPVNIDPSAPALPISTPEDYSEKLCEEIGLYYTQGIPEDTKALSENILDDNEFLRQSHLVWDEELRLFEYELNRHKSGLLFFYIGRVDQLGHMFWRTLDPNHPAYDPAIKHLNVIEETYREMDHLLKKAIDKLDPNSTLIVLSDHGFASFRRAFNLNSWLKFQGYVSLANFSEGEFLQNVDWSRTKAYGLGFNSLYLNLQGREREGIVKPGAEKEALLDEVAKKLMSICDPKTGEQVISKVYKAGQVYSGPHLKSAPDLIIGYNRGYRASWESVLGQFSPELLRDNTEKWSGDHLVEAGLVPGILFSNKKISSQKPAICDLAPTILAEFGIPKQEGMVGNRLF